MFVALFIFLVTKEVNADKIVSLAPVITEIVLSLGKGSDLVGVTDLCEVSPELNPKKLGNYNTISSEAAIALAPSLVLLMKDQRGQAVHFKKMGIKTLEIQLNSLSDITSNIEEMSKALKVEVDGKNLVSSIKSKINEILLTKIEEKKILFTFGDASQITNTTGLYVSGNNTIYDEIIKSLKYINVVTQSGYPLMSVEGVCSLKPDCIIIATDRALDQRFKEALSGCLSHAKIITAPKNPTLYPGMRISEIYQQFIRCDSE